MALVALALVAIAIVGWAALTGAVSTDDLGEDALRSRIEGWGAFGPIGFVLVMWLVQPVGVPGVVLMVPASLVWSAPTAIALSWVGNMGASWLAFEVTRAVGQDWVADRIPPKVRAFDARLARGGFLPIFLLRVLTGQLPAADWMLGVSSVRRLPFFLGTGLGILPGIVAVVLWGADLIQWLLDRPLLAVPVVVGIVGWRVRSRLGERSA